MARPLMLGVLLLVLLSLGGPRAAYAAPTRTFALVVANNRSPNLTLPDLKYADDDAARYYRLFRAVAEPAQVALLTTFDRSSRSLYPELAALAQPPSYAELDRAVARLAEAIKVAHAKGERSVFYFVFAGHGDVLNGRGQLELADGAIDGAFIERRIVEKVAAETQHVLLDSCNSFFVFNPRKPGGRRWATPHDMALGFSARHPEVGLFLSTNSNEEVFEWSELESGVFSHEVRSGLSGAADVNHDGRVTYSELAGFVEQANAGIPRETLRPQLYYRGPFGKAEAALFSPSALTGRRVELDSAETRLWVKGETGERLADLHKEAGPLTLVLPDGGKQDLTLVVQQRAPLTGGRPTLVELKVAKGEEPIRMALLSASAPLLSARGDQIFGNWFAAPYGPKAHAAFTSAPLAPAAPVYGVSRADVERMDHYLTAMADQGRFERRMFGATLMGFGVAAGAGAIAANFDDPRWSNAALIGTGAGAAALFGSGLYLTLTSSGGEDALATFQRELAARRNNPALAFARTELELQRVAAGEQTSKMIQFWTLETLGVGVAALNTALLLAPKRNGDSTDHLQPSAAALGYSVSALLIGSGFWLLQSETPTQRFLRLYQQDPALRLSAGITPLPGGAALSIAGKF